MSDYKLFPFMTDNQTLYETFKSVERQGIKCLTLNPKDADSPKRVELFRFRIFRKNEVTGNPEYAYIAVSYMPETSTSNACYTLDLLRTNDGKTSSVTPDRGDCHNAIALTKEFLDKVSAANGGVIAKLNANKKYVNDKTPDPDNINYYLGVLDGLKVRHRGSEPQAKWKYELSEEEANAVSEAFKNLFRHRQNINTLGITESYSIRSAYSASLADSNVNTEEYENSEPVF